MRTRSLALLALLLPAIYVACDEPNLVDNPSFDLWCGASLCSWSTDVGRIERVATWHRGDYGVSFEETPTQISQLSLAAPVRCMRIDLIADVAASAQMTLGFDFNDDGVVEHQQAVPAVSWRSVQFLVHTPLDYRSLRYVLRKAGRGHAVIAQLRIVEELVEEGSPCLTEPVELPDGAACTVDGVCASGACLAGTCSRCADAASGSCAAGEACHLDTQCASGSCAGGTCSDCGAAGSCAALAPCDADAECQSGACVPGFAPSRATEPAACLHCTADADCGAEDFCATDLGACGSCQLGAASGRSVLPRQCAGCTGDAQCGDGGVCTFHVCSTCRSDADCAAGESCRSADAFDFGARACRPAPRELPRGALCSRDADCAGGLRCGGAASEPARCGLACESDHEVCGAEAACAVPGLSGTTASIAFAYRPRDAWSTPAGRVATCFPLRREGQPEQGCELHTQCRTNDPWPFDQGACCEGRCDYERSVDADSGACNAAAEQASE